MLKYKISIILLFILCLYSIGLVNAMSNTLPLLGKVIYIDPGHGGKDPGAMYNGIMEKDINLEISKILEKKLLKMGAVVYLTRYGDYDLSVNHTNNRKRSDLSRRSNIINKTKPDLYLSIHLNAEETGLYRGAQVFYSNNNQENEKLAKLFQNEFKKNLNSFRKYKKDNNLYLEKRIKVPGILIEIGFLSNNNERYLLKKKYYLEKVSNIIVNSTIKYFNFFLLWYNIIGG